MAGFERVKAIVDEAYDGGKNVYASFRKIHSLVTTLGVWTDLSMAPGNPKANFYVGTELNSATFDGNFGLFHFGAGRTTTDGFKFLHKLQLYSPSATYNPAKFMLCDYLMFYPLIDMDNTDAQIFNDGVANPVTLPRYTDGLGVQAFLVATNPYVGGARFQIEYTNERGETGRKSHWTLTNTLAGISTIVHAGVGVGIGHPFIQLQPGDLGIRSVQNIIFDIPNGGLATLVLVKPLATVCTGEITAVTETDFIYEIPSLPKIYDGAYLNFLCMPNGSVAGQVLQGEITTIWR